MSLQNFNRSKDSAINHLRLLAKNAEALGIDDPEIMAVHFDALQFIERLQGLPGIIECDLCGKVVAGVESAIEADWEPSYWIGEEEQTENPICPDCACNRCYLDRGETTLIVPELVR